MRPARRAAAGSPPNSATRVPTFVESRYSDSKLMADSRLNPRSCRTADLDDRTLAVLDRLDRGDHVAVLGRVARLDLAPRRIGRLGGDLEILVLGPVVLEVLVAQPFGHHIDDF